MRLSLLTDYALRTLIYLAGKTGRVQVAELAAFYHISVHHLAKVAHQLGQRGYIKSIRGVGGGLELAQPANAVTIGQVIADFEPTTHLLECVGTPQVCVIQPGCRLRLILHQAERVQLDYLRSVTLADVVVPGGQLQEFQPLVPLELLPPATRRGGTKKRAKRP